MTATAVEISCTSCGAKLTVDAQHRTTVCPYCDTPSVVERPPAPDRPTPSFVLGFVVDKVRAGELVRKWIAGAGPFAKSGFKEATVEKVRGLYLPAYLYGAVARSSWSASIGEDYKEEETYTETNEKGETVTKTRTVTKTEWTTLHGNWSGYVLDVLVTASKGISNDELEEIEPFDLRALRRYNPALVAGWIAEEPSIARDDSLKLARDEANADVTKRLTAFMPGDHHRALEHQTSLDREVLDLLLLPVWVFAARWAPDQPPVKILVNGQTGEVQGKVPLSWVKILSALAVMVGLIAAIALVVSK